MADGATATTLETNTEARKTQGFRRLAAISGFVTVAVGVVTGVLQGIVPVLGDSATEVAAYYANSIGAHRLAVVIAALLAIPITIILVGVYRSLSTADVPQRSAWATVFLYGAIMSSATAGLREVLYAAAVHYGSAGLEPATLQVLSDGSHIAGATLGVWLAVTIGSVAIVSFLSKNPVRWYGWLCVIVATLGILSVIDTVSISTGGVFAALGFAGFVLWMLITAIVMYRRPLIT